MEKLLFHVLRLVPVHFITDEITSEAILKAMTVNEELIRIGYKLSPADVIALSQTSELNNFYDYVKKLHGEVSAKPMYPGFPDEVMKLDKAVLRFHQLLHYMSTYGLEAISGQPVLKGWLPESDAPKRIKSDKILLSAKVIALIDVKDMYAVPFKKILSKAEKMTQNEKDIINICVRNLDFEQLTSVNIEFKENLKQVFLIIYNDSALTSEQKITALHKLCQHTGDVFKCIEAVLRKSRYHLHTSQKRMLTKLLESYPESDLRDNLIITNKKARQTEKLLRYLDYNIYSRNENAKKLVAMLRNGELRSWEGKAKEMVSKKDPAALEFIAKRPGTALRMITYLLRNGYSAEQIKSAMLPQAGALSAQTLISLLNYFGRESVYNVKFEALQIFDICEKLLEARFAVCQTPLKDKKIFIDSGEMSMEYSSISIEKSETQGYLNSGMVYTIPQSANKIRFFVYWNDSERVDIDLHATALTEDGDKVCIGWNGNYTSKSMTYSGDITYSDAAEYIDIDVYTTEIEKIAASIHLYSGKPSFKDVEVCFAGCMLVKELGQDVKLYDPANCMFVNHINMNETFIKYGFIDLNKRIVLFLGKPEKEYYEPFNLEINRFNLKRYFEILEKAQNIQFVSSREEADNILVMGKPASEKEISFTDENFFMDYKKM